MTEIARLTERAAVELAPGVDAYLLFGEGAMLSLVDLDASAVVPLHSHPHEQLGLVISGQITMSIDGVDRALGPEGAYVIPGGIVHGATAGPSGCRVVDVFRPIREDYRKLAEGG